MISFFKKLFFKNQTSSIGICSICGKEFKDSALELHNTLAFCSTDYSVFKNNDWTVIIDVKSDPNNPQAALHTQNIKDILQNHNIPSFITVSYESNDAVIFSRFNLSIPKLQVSKYHSLSLPKQPL
jgi:hypothetical protein